MKNNASIIYNFCLIIGDFLALLTAFVVAYVLRVTVSDRQISQQVFALDYAQNLAAIIPFFILIFALLGLYGNRMHEKRFSELGNLLIGCFIGILFIISYSYMFNTPIFPARLVVLYGFGLAFFFVLLFRTIARGLRRELFNYGIGINNVIIIGDTRLANNLIQSLANTAVTGYKVKALVSAKLKPGRLSSKFMHFASFNEAVTAFPGGIHTIIQTELYARQEDNDEILTYAQENHIAYRFVPGNNELFTGNIDAEVFHSVPVIAVHQTPLTGWGRVVKRLFDVVAASLAIIVFSPFMLVILLYLLLSGGTPIYYRKRLTRFNSYFTIYKFRSLKIAYNGLDPEAGFAKMGKPELAAEFRRNGDFLENDPRISKFGKFIRITSLDELPQLFNVLRGDISLVGPRALIEEELNQSRHKNVILSVKPGLTGLAVVSGRKDIAFEERRALDLYYVQNWSFWGDIVILIKTVWIVLTHKGAR